MLQTDLPIVFRIFCIFQLGTIVALGIFKAIGGYGVTFISQSTTHEGFFSGMLVGAAYILFSAASIFLSIRGITDGTVRGQVIGAAAGATKIALFFLLAWYAFLAERASGIGLFCGILTILPVGFCTWFCTRSRFASAGNIE